MTEMPMINEDDFGPEHFLELGQRLMDQQTPAAIRTGISRLYYANFLLAAQKLAAKRGYQPHNDGGDHGGLIRFMKKNGGRLRNAGETLDDLREARAHADYHALGEDGCKYCPNAPERSEFSQTTKDTLSDHAVKLFKQLSSL